MEIANHIEAIGREGERLATAASQAGLDASIRWCPGWDMRELLRHLSEIHLWAASHVARRAVREGVSELNDLETAWPDLALFPTEGPIDDVFPRSDSWLKIARNLDISPRTIAPQDVGSPPSP